jgi:hypothetical protein
MARDAVAVQKVGNDLSLTPIVWHAQVAANDTEITGCTKRTVILFRNAGATDPQVATIVSVDDIYGRSGDVAVSVAAGEVGAYGLLRPDNFYQIGTRTVYVDTATEDSWEIAAIDFDFAL